MCTMEICTHVICMYGNQYNHVQCTCTCMSYCTCTEMVRVKVYIVHCMATYSRCPTTQVPVTYIIVDPGVVQEVHAPSQEI